MKGNRQDMYYSNWFIKVNFAAAIENPGSNLRSPHNCGTNVSMEPKLRLRLTSLDTTLQPPFGIRHAEDQTFTNPVGGNIFRNQLSAAVLHIYRQGNRKVK